MTISRRYMKQLAAKLFNNNIHLPTLHALSRRMFTSWKIWFFLAAVFCGGGVVRL